MTTTARLSDKVFIDNEYKHFKDVLEGQLGAKFDSVAQEGEVCGVCGITLYECRVTFSKPDDSGAQWSRILDFCKQSGFKVLKDGSTR
jgi:hypothetical protein